MSVFLAWVPDEDARRTLAGIAEMARRALGDGEAPHRWRRPDQWHMTLRHLGDGLAPGLRPRIDAHMDAIACAVPAHRAEPDGLDAWRDAKVLVLRTDLPPPLADLFDRVEAGMRDCGFRADDRTVRPHVTLAYLDARHWPEATALPRLPQALPPFAIDRVRLLENPGTGGYRSLAEWTLAGAGLASRSSPS